MSQYAAFRKEQAIRDDYTYIWPISRIEGGETIIYTGVECLSFTTEQLAEIAQYAVIGPIESNQTAIWDQWLHDAETRWSFMQLKATDLDQLMQLVNAAYASVSEQDRLNVFMGDVQTMLMNKING